jgi:hypothetical protein
MIAMGKKDKPICKWDKDEIKEKLDDLKELVSPARYICRKCGRAAKKDDHLCKPEKI